MLALGLNETILSDKPLAELMDEYLDTNELAKVFLFMYRFIEV